MMLIKPTLLSCALVLVLIPIVALAAKVDPEVDAFNVRLNALRANSEVADATRYEQLLAQQAVAALADARRRERDQLLYLADRRVEIAETTVRIALLRRQLDQLAGTRNDLLIEESRREAARARHEAEQLRIQSQIQAEEAERARHTAEAEAIARQNAEQALSNVAEKQQANLSVAQQKAAQLAREEAELLSGAKLPPSRFDERIEIFTFGTEAYAGGKKRFSSSARAQIQALAQYLKIVKEVVWRLLVMAVMRWWPISVVKSCLMLWLLRVYPLIDSKSVTVTVTVTSTPKRLKLWCCPEYAG